MDTGAVAGSKQREVGVALTDLHDGLLDEPCWSARDVLELIGHVRGIKPRDGLRVLEDCIFDLVERV